MTTVNTVSTKVNGSWVQLVPNATTSSKGIVQVGSGLSVSNGVISVSGGSSVFCPNVSYANNSGFKVGTITRTLNTHTCERTGADKTSNYRNLGTQYTPFTQQKTYASCPPFTINSTSSFVSSTLCTFTATVKMSTYWNVDKYYSTYGFRAIRVRDSLVLGEKTGSYSGSSSAVDVSFTASIPSDWTDSDLIQFQFYNNAYSMHGNYAYAGTLVTGSTITSPVYYAPVQE